MRCLYVLILSVGSLCASSETFSLPNVNATFVKSPKPFQIHVDRGFIEDTRQRAAHTRSPLFINESSDGPGAENFTSVRNFWVNEYDWNATEASINRRFEQFTTIVEPEIDNVTHSVPLHFVHHRSPRSDAIPLLFIHGWPGSFLEVGNIIKHLTNPPNSSVPAFHVVAPSIPGFGFSPAPMQPGFGPAAASYAFNELMLQLGYSRYVIQGGDFGGVILRYQAHNFPKNVISALSNFWIIQPGNNDLRRLTQGEATPDEVTYIKIIENYENQGSGYRLIMSTEPLTLANGMTDSPLGNAMWMYSIMKRVIDPAIMAWTPEEIITWSMMYWIQGPYGGMRFYKEVQNDGGFETLDFGTLPLVEVPVAISQFPYDLTYRMPLDWAKRGGNVLKRTIHDHGGHFAAYEVPDLLLHDIWSWFGDKEGSGTKAFD
ncbi:epoxide hydrolase [Fusarium pseudocircinatum]|uniref:Epoxide hydrolase n=1 Tax=Fusarium pseudocircinatum TaxID=56676 RepID=A0A8H5UVN9_9HYPO|nr:epoxide hydrolase [Fusarium pseudocircinatum]